MKLFMRVVLSAALFMGYTGTLNGQETPPIGDWKGEIDAGGQIASVIFHVSRTEDGGLKATVDSPEQGVTGLEFDTAVWADGTLTLSVDIPEVTGEYIGAIDDDGSHMTGVWSQGGAAFPLDLERFKSDDR